MEVMCRIGKILAPTICIVFGLLYLNGAAYSWWASWGPPTEYPELFQHQAITRFGLSVALFATAPLLFIVFKNRFNLAASKYKYWWLVILVIALGGSYLRVLLLQDSCLDSGGSWQVSKLRCQHEQ